MTEPSADAVRALFGGAADLVERRVLAGGQTVTVFFLDGLTSGSQIADFVLRPLSRSLVPGTMEELFRQAAGGAVCCASMLAAARAADRFKPVFWMLGSTVFWGIIPILILLVVLLKKVRKKE